MNNTSAKQQIVEGIRDNTNILVTVSTDPSVDELSAALGLTAFLNKLGKHATAVVSGKLPPAITFLKPDKTFESSADSLRDFIIALDKEKADHLRYKLEGDVVKIFITPYRTTLSSDDLDFSQGDYNVEMVIALNVEAEEHLDKALSAHGKILHDAFVSTVSAGSVTSTLGSVDWHDDEASSVSEMLVGLTEALKTAQAGLDEQIATALLTGIVAATERFSNNLTSSRVMTMAAQLMAAGANQQLISNHLEEAAEVEKTESTPTNDKKKQNQPKKSYRKTGRSEDGALVISHEKEGDLDEVARQTQAEKQQEAAQLAQAKVDEQTKQAEKKDATLLTVPKEASDQESTDSDTTDAADAETALASATMPEPQTPSIHQDLMDETAALTQPVTPAPTAPSMPEPAPSPVDGLPPLPTISPAQSSVRADEDQAQTPSLGGTLNATTDQAADEARREAQKGQNKTILSHGGYVGDQEATFANTPINGSLITDTPPKVDPFGAPPASAAPALLDGSSVPPTNVGQESDARAAVDAALQAEPPAPAPVQQPIEPSPAEAEPLMSQPAFTPPPLPPMPDFSTLPPLPPMPDGMPQAPQATNDMSQQPAMPTEAPVAQPEMSPEAFAPQDVTASQAPSSNNPGQFKIPGQ